MGISVIRSLFHLFDIKPVIARRHWARLRRLVRAHRALMSDSEAAAGHLNITRMLFLQPLPIPSWGSFGIVPAPYDRHMETVVRQRISAKVLSSSLMPELMASRHRPERPLVLPLPRTWRTFLAANGFRINNFRSRLSLLIMQAGFLGGACVRTWRLITSRESGPTAPTAGYAVFVDAPRGVLPRTPEAYGRADGLVRWYMEGSLRLPDETAAWVINPGLADQWQAYGITAADGPLPPLKSVRQKLRFAAAAGRILTIGTVVSGLGAWWVSALLSEALLLAYIRCFERTELARTYLFNNSAYILRPLWTYYAEDCGCRVIMVFYSTNMQRLMWLDGTVSPVFPGNEIMTWSEYAVWNKEQQDFLVEIGQTDATYHLCGRVDIEDSGDALPKLPHNSVAVFDVAPFRPSALARIGMAPPYYSASTARQFIEDVEAAIARAGLSMVTKSKREAGKAIDPSYMRYLAMLSEKGRLITAPPSVSVKRLAVDAVAAVTMPFSSAAIAAESLGVPSVYYDPTGLLASLRPKQAVSIQVITNVTQLTDWLIAVATPPATCAGTNRSLGE